jgi:ATP-binding cassette subfamily B protein
MSTLLTGRTTFVIAHRLSTIRRADLILLMQEGRVVERGTHDELMRAGGQYQEMVRRQVESHGDDLSAGAPVSDTGTRVAGEAPLPRPA